MSNALSSSPTSPQNGRFQRVFTDSDEIRLLKSLTKAAAKSESPQITTVDSVVFNRINRSLGSKFTHTQISDKVRRLRAKYHKQARSKSLIRTHHDQRVFKICRKIWGKNTGNQRAKSLQEAGDANDGASLEEEEEKEKEEEEAVGNGGGVCGGEREEKEGGVSLEDFPALVSEFSRSFPENNVWKDGLSCLGKEKLREMNDKWMLLRIEEAKLMAKRADLVSEQTRLAMEAVVSSSKRN